MQTEQKINPENFNILKPKKALNKAFLKVKPNRSQIEQGEANSCTEKRKSSSLEAEIDRLVYVLYGLTEEEIEIVEGSVDRI